MTTSDQDQRVDLVALTATSCRWPCGEAPVRYCGANTGNVLGPYCPAHHRLAYQRRASREETAVAERLAYRRAAT